MRGPLRRAAGLARGSTRLARSELDVLRSRRGRADLALFHEFAPSPAGGGHQFLRALVGELERRGLAIEVGTISGDTPACLFNSFNFDFRRLRRFARRGALAVLAAIAVAFAPAFCANARIAGEHEQALAVIATAELPPEAQRTIRLIRDGGPFTYERDGVVFGNFERRLPARERGYYREYTVPTPGVKHRGLRRIVAGRKGELYYSDDHYQSFRRVTQ